MSAADNPEHASSTLARRALLVTLGLALAGALSGLVAARLGMVGSTELALVVCSVLFSTVALTTLFLFRKVALQTVATVSTSFFALNLCAGVVIAAYNNAEHLNLFVYLVWFFPLLVLNKLVNQPAVGRLLAKILLIVPELLIVCLLPRLIVVLAPAQLVLLGVYFLSYVCFALTLNIVTRYREKYIVEQERMESLKVASEVLESISDCFISLDSSFRLVYLNDAACAEFGVERRTALNDTLSNVASSFFSKSLQAQLLASSAGAVATIFEAHNEARGMWYDLRCFPRPDGMAIYFRDVTARKMNEARIEYLAFYDVLTGLPNRQLLRDRLATAIATAASQGTTGAILYIDLDDFKTLNETMGHAMGDVLLQQVAVRLTSCLQSSDTVARIGGDEFIVILDGLGNLPMTSAAIAKNIGNRILDLFLSPFAIGTYESEITASIGTTFFTGTSDSVDDLLKRADLAMYSAKAEGRNTMRFFDSAMQVDVDTRATLRADLRRALQNGEFELHYQPQVNSDGTVMGSEALLRWFHPLRGKVPPDEFIPLAEEAGLIIELGRWVLETACLQLAAWAKNSEMEGLTLAVNVSIRQFLDPQFVAVVQETLRISGANPHRLKLEITESSVMENVNEMIAKMRHLRLYGVGFSLDDFGTGYSSLSYLRHLPLDQLKIDRSFVNNVLTDAKDASIARTVIMLGRSLNLSVIAEGVETTAQRDFLKEEGCHFYQGFLYSPAVPITQFEIFVAASIAKLHRAHASAVLLDR